MSDTQISATEVKKNYDIVWFSTTVLPWLFVGYGVYSLVKGSFSNFCINILIAMAFRYYRTPLRLLPLWVKLAGAVVFISLLTSILT